MRTNYRDEVLGFAMFILVMVILFVLIRVFTTYVMEGGDPVDQRSSLSVGVSMVSALDGSGDTPADSLIRAARLRVVDTREEQAARLLGAANESCEATEGDVARVLEAHPRWDVLYVVGVACRQVGRGMSAEQVRESIGSPKRVNSTVGAYGSTEQWVYGVGKYLYFEDGVLNSYQNTR